MPRNSNTYSLPVGWAAVRGAQIQSAKYNASLQDIEADLNWLSATFAQRRVDQVEGLKIRRALPAGPAYVDLNATGEPTADYSARLLRDGGANGELTLAQTGTGNINITGGSALLRNGSPIWTSADSPAMKFGQIGSLVFAYNISASTILPDATIPGSSLGAAGVYSGSGSIAVTNLTLWGTWRCLGYAPSTYLTLFVRVA